MPSVNNAVSSSDKLLMMGFSQFIQISKKSPDFSKLLVDYFASFSHNAATLRFISDNCSCVRRSREIQIIYFRSLFIERICKDQGKILIIN